MKIEEITKMIIEELKANIKEEERAEKLNSKTDEEDDDLENLKEDNNEYSDFSRGLNSYLEGLESDNISDMTFKKSSDEREEYSQKDDKENETQDNLKNDLNKDEYIKDSPNSNLEKECGVLVSQSKKNSSNLKSEAQFLSAVKERILVLFEGLNSFEVTDIEARVELNIKFLEFLLASIDERLENLSK